MRSSFVKNTSWIFFGNIAHAIFQYLINIICARYFGVNDYGIINYASSIIAFFITIGTLGFNGIITKKFAENEKRVGDYLGTALYSRIIFSIVAIILIQISMRLIGDSNIVIQVVVFCQSLQILFGSTDLVLYWYQYKNNAKLVAVLRLIAFFISSIWKLASILIFDSLILYVLGVSLETLLFGLLLMKSYFKDYKEYRLLFKVKTFKELLKISYPFIFSALLCTIYAQTDKMMLKNMLSESAVGLYSVSQTLAGAISIIPSALIEGFRPEIMKLKKFNLKEYKKKFQQLYGMVFWICILYCIFITVFAEPIVSILYGEAYLGAVSSLGLIVWYTSFSFFGAINNMYMVAENKTIWVQVTTLVGSIVNVLLNYLLIPIYGIVGAAAASLITQVIANFILVALIKNIREVFFIMLKGIMLKGFRDTELKKLLIKRRKV